MQFVKADDRRSGLISHNTLRTDDRRPQIILAIQAIHLVICYISLHYEQPIILTAADLNQCNTALN